MPDYLGTVVHDALAVYDSYPASHALRGAHLLRQLVAANESEADLPWPIQAHQAPLNSAARNARDNGHAALDSGWLPKGGTARMISPGRPWPVTADTQHAHLRGCVIGQQALQLRVEILDLPGEALPTLSQQLQAVGGVLGRGDGCSGWP